MGHKGPVLGPKCIGARERSNPNIIHSSAWWRSIIVLADGLRAMLLSTVGVNYADFLRHFPYGSCIYPWIHLTLSSTLSQVSSHYRAVLLLLLMLFFAAVAVVVGFSPRRSSWVSRDNRHLPQYAVRSYVAVARITYRHTTAGFALLAGTFLSGQ
jgi:hypothetical protein